MTDSYELEQSVHGDNLTNSRAEAVAILRLLQAVRRGNFRCKRLQVFCDSLFLVDYINLQSYIEELVDLIVEIF